MADAPSPEQRIDIQNAIYAGNKLAAIKLYRLATGEDLKESKDAVDKLAEELRALDPARFAKPRELRGTFTAIFFWGAVVCVLIFLARRWLD